MSSHRMLLAMLLLSATLEGAPAVQSQPQRTEIEGVTASLAYARVSNGVTRVGILLTNAKDQPINAGKGISYSDVFMIDEKNGRKQFAFKDGEGHYLAGPISDWDGGGRWIPNLAANSETLFWVMFSALSPGTKVSIHAPLLQPFDDVEVKEGSASSKDDPGTGAPPLHISLVSASRASGQLRVRLKILSTGKSTPVDSGVIHYKDVRIFDPPNKTLYSLLRNPEGTYAAQPLSDKAEGGRYALATMQPGGQTFMSLTFEAPPDTIKQVDILVPWFGPIEGVPIGGDGG